jgi:hypothetical protein
MILYRNYHFAFHGLQTAEKIGHRWYTRLAKARGSRFIHVSAFYYDPRFSVWQVIEWSPHGTFFGAWDDHLLDTYLAIIFENGGRTLQYRAKESSMRRLPVFGFDYCVTAAKQLANIRSWALTPDQLFCALQRRGAHASFESLIPEGEVDGRALFKAEDART